jgi:hypothetical protein
VVGHAHAVDQRNPRAHGRGQHRDHRVAGARHVEHALRDRGEVHGRAAPGKNDIPFSERVSRMSAPQTAWAAATAAAACASVSHGMPVASG